MKCKEDTCNIRASFNLLNENKPIYCNKHKQIDMINIISKRCLEENCNTHPTFNLPNAKCGIYCNQHKKVDMVDVLSKKCLEEHCNTRPSYNLPNTKIAIYCKECLECRKLTKMKKGEEIHKCDFCKMEIDRDVLGSTNILLKNW